MADQGANDWIAPPTSPPAGVDDWITAPSDGGTDVTGGQAPQPSGLHTNQPLGFYEDYSKVMDRGAQMLHSAAGNVSLSDLFLPGVAGAISQVTGHDAPTLQSTIDQLGGMLGMPSVQDAIKAHKSYIQSQEDQGERPGTMGRIAGDVAATAPLMFENPVVGGALTGGLLSDKTDPQGVLTDMGIGAAGGKFGDWAMRGAANVVAPKLSSAVNTLLQEGVGLTPGQILGGATRRVEDAASRLPFVGSLVRGAQNRSISDFNTAVANRALGQVGETVPANIKPGHDLVTYVGDRLGQKYNELIPNLSVNPDDEFQNGILGHLDTVKDLPQDQQGEYNRIYRDYIAKLEQPGATGADLQAARSEVGRQAKRYSSAPAPADRNLGDLLSSTRDTLDDMVERSNPDQLPQLQAIDRGWASLARIEKAASRASPTSGGQETGGIYTPTALKSAILQADTTARKRGTARGTQILQDIAEAGQRVLPQSVADSGTVERGLTSGALLGGLPYLAAHAEPTTAAILGGLTGAYTRPGQALLRGAIASRPTVARGLADAMRNNTGVAGIGGAAALSNAMQPSP